MKKVILITGSSGGIGKAIVDKFIGEDYHVIGLDKKKFKTKIQNFQFFEYDLRKIKNNESLKELKHRLNFVIGKKKLVGIINNSAIQNLEKKINPQSIFETFIVNTFAPLFITQINASKLIKNNGTVVNISSIHTSLTKKGFMQYAASKSALSSITRSLAIDYGGRIKFISVSPGAIDTSMLRLGIKNSNLDELNATQVIGRVGQPKDIANIVFYLITQAPEILNGAEIAADGGNSKLLNDV